MNRGLRFAFDANTALTFVAFALLVVRPKMLPDGVGVYVDPSGYFLGYMLGAAESGLATMTFLGRRITDRQALRAISLACIVFHLCSAAVLIVTFANGGSDFPLGLWANVVIPRFGIAALCAYFGLHRLRVNAK